MLTMLEAAEVYVLLCGGFDYPTSTDVLKELHPQTTYIFDEWGYLGFWWALKEEYEREQQRREETDTG